MSARAAGPRYAVHTLEALALQPHLPLVTAAFLRCELLPDRL
jgi:hypothetical protein